jgi:hypothetical protein
MLNAICVALVGRRVSTSELLHRNEITRITKTFFHDEGLYRRSDDLVVWLFAVNNPKVIRLRCGNLVLRAGFLWSCRQGQFWSQNKSHWHYWSALDFLLPCRRLHVHAQHSMGMGMGMGMGMSQGRGRCGAVGGTKDARRCSSKTEDNVLNIYWAKTRWE